MKNPVRITLHPLGTDFEVERGRPLHDILFPYGVEFPCGGRGRCKGCRVRVLAGNLPVTPEQERMLSKEEIGSGWRLACQCNADSDLVIELAQWEAAILTDETNFSFTPRDGLGVAVDVGTTTLVAQLLDLRQAQVLAVRTALNPQARHGADIMSRVGFAVAEGGHRKLVDLLRRQIGKMIHELLEAAKVPSDGLHDIVLVGNTVMHHLFCDIDLEPLSHYPFEPADLGLHSFAPQQLGWTLPEACSIRFLPCIGGYVGSDILAGVLATNLHNCERTESLIDLGTNGEIVIGNRDRLICCSTAAGPAFEGARISMGMRAATGAISEVSIHAGALSCYVLGNVTPRGICGSGLVDAVAACLDLGSVAASGRLQNGEGYLMLRPPVKISQTDVRELQLAKGAIAAGVRILLEELGTGPERLHRIHLAGAFGNYVNTTSSQRIGLINFPSEMVHPAGNTALLGAKMALYSEEAMLADLAHTIEHMTLSSHPHFQDIYVEEMTFPQRLSSD